VTDEGGRYTLPLPEDVQGAIMFHHPRFAGPLVRFAVDGRALEPTTLDPAGSIVGAVAVAGPGRPVAGARVLAGTLEFGNTTAFGRREAATDDRGRFEVGGLFPGVYDLVLIDGPAEHRSITAVALEGVRVRVGEDTKVDLRAVEGRGCGGR